MLSKATIKYIQSLQQKKYRQQHLAFVVEGEKLAKEVLAEKETRILHIFALQTWVDQQSTLRSEHKAVLQVVNNKELKRISSLKTANQIVIIAEQYKNQLPNNLDKDLHLVLDNIQDPGNLGTIIRIADWFGIKHIFCSPTCVDMYNPKVVQSTMGGIFRVKLHYLPLEPFVESQKDTPIYAAVLGGENLYEKKLEAKGLLLIGNESKGISPTLQALVKHKLTIPKFGQAESLNAAVATGILCAFFRS